MGFPRILVVVDPAAPVAPVMRVARRVAPAASHVHVLALVEAGAPEAELALLEQGLGRTLERCFDPARVAAIARREQVSLVVFGPWPSASPRARALALLELSGSVGGVDVLSVGERCRVPPPGAVLAVSFDVESEALGSATAAVRALPDTSRVVALVRSATAAQLELLEPRLRALLPDVALECVGVDSHLPTLAEDLDREAAARGAALLVVATDELWRVSRLVAGLAGAEAMAHAERPILVLRRPGLAWHLAERLSATDVLRLPGRALPITLERTSDLGRSALAVDETFSLVGAEARGPLPHADGVVSLPADWLPADVTGLALVSTAHPAQVAHARVVAAPRLALLASDCPAEAWPDVEAFAREHTLVAVRLRAEETLEALRRRLDAGVPWGGPVPLLDASAWLDDAGAVDVPKNVDGLRLLRLALHLVTAGAPVAAVIAAADAPLESGVVQAWTPASLQRRSPLTPLGLAARRGADEAARWAALTGSEAVPGHRVALELDNGAARRGLLAAIGAARRSVYWQCYIVDHDAVAMEVVAALEAAARRGVSVRVLVDSLYSLHDIYGAKNPVLARLAGVPGVEVRGTRPMAGVPTLEDLKCRNHRKLVVIDGRQATVSGRNLGQAYYRGYDEVRLAAETAYDEVPWLDASATVEGPLVEAVARCFARDWTRSGGAPFEVEPVAPAGPLTCRLVTHEGLRDGHTLDAQRELIHGARRSVTLVNTFPLALELQRALLAALGRGVAVTLLFGNVRPRWGQAHAFPGGRYRGLADELVRARLAPVLQAGARGFEFALPSEGLGRVFPHVHAKLFTRDDELVLVGSANLDVTSGYWESEALLAVHDAGFARETAAALDALLATSRRVDPTDPAWQEALAWRSWLGDNWPVLVG